MGVCYAPSMAKERTPHLCTTCGESNPPSFYGADKSICKKCKREQSANNCLEAKLNPPMIGERRICVRCNTEKDAYHDFYYHNKSWCKSCMIKRASEDYLKHYFDRMLRAAKIRARAKGIPFSISRKDLNIPSHCPVLGVKLEIGGGRDEVDNSPSIDRFDNSRGYTPDNVRIISYRANRLKSDATLQELKAIIAYMEESPNTSQSLQVCP